MQKDKEAKAKEAKAKEAREKEAKAKDAKAREAREREAREKEKEREKAKPRGKDEAPTDGEDDARAARAAADAADAERRAAAAAAAAGGAGGSAGAAERAEEERDDRPRVVAYSDSEDDLVSHKARVKGLKETILPPKPDGEGERAAEAAAAEAEAAAEAAEAAAAARPRPSALARLAGALFGAAAREVTPGVALRAGALALLRERAPRAGAAAAAAAGAAALLAAALGLALDAAAGPAAARAGAVGAARRQAAALGRAALLAAAGRAAAAARRRALAAHVERALSGVDVVQLAALAAARPAPPRPPEADAEFAALYAPEIHEMARMLGECGVAPPPARFGPDGAELFRFAAAAGLLEAGGEPATAAAALERGVRRVIDTTEWAARQAPPPPARLARWERLVAWRGADAAGRPILLVRLGRALQLCGTPARLEEFAAAVLAQVEAAAAGRLPRPSAAGRRPPAPPDGPRAPPDAAAAARASLDAARASLDAGAPPAAAAAAAAAASAAVMSGGPDRLVAVVDCRGASNWDSLARSRHVLALVRRLSLDLATHYPGRLHRLYLLEAPLLARVAVNAGLAPLSPATRERVVQADAADAALPITVALLQRRKSVADNLGRPLARSLSGVSSASSGGAGGASSDEAEGELAAPPEAAAGPPGAGAGSPTAAEALCESTPPAARAAPRYEEEPTPPMATPAAVLDDETATPSPRAGAAPGAVASHSLPWTPSLLSPESSMLSRLGSDASAAEPPPGARGPWAGLAALLSAMAPRAPAGRAAPSPRAHRLARISSSSFGGSSAGGGTPPTPGARPEPPLPPPPLGGLLELPPRPGSAPPPARRSALRPGAPPPPLGERRGAGAAGAPPPGSFPLRRQASVSWAEDLARVREYSGDAAAEGAEAAAGASLGALLALTGNLVQRVVAGPPPAAADAPLEAPAAPPAADAPLEAPSAPPAADAPLETPEAPEAP